MFVSYNHPSIKVPSCQQRSRETACSSLSHIVYSACWTVKQLQRAPGRQGVYTGRAS